MIEGDEGAQGAQGRKREPSAFSLRRWSQRKHQTALEIEASARKSPPAPAPGADASDAPLRAGPVAGRGANTSFAPHDKHNPAHTPGQAAPASPADTAAVAELPPIEMLTADSDFAPFMRPGVDATLRREALKKLLHDPRFNVMDGLDVYIDDYTKSTPIEASVARRLLARLHPRASDEPATGVAGNAGNAGNAPPAPEPDRGTVVTADSRKEAGAAAPVSPEGANRIDATAGEEDGAGMPAADPAGTGGER